MIDGDESSRRFASAGDVWSGDVAALFAGDGGHGGHGIAADEHGGGVARGLLRPELPECGGDCEECHGQGDGTRQRHRTWSSPPPLPRLLRRSKPSQDHCCHCCRSTEFSLSCGHGKYAQLAKVSQQMT